MQSREHSDRPHLAVLFALRSGGGTPPLQLMGIVFRAESRKAGVEVRPTELVRETHPT